MAVLPKRFAKYGLTLHPEKTRLVDFGRYAEAKAKRQGKNPATFDFLGFTHICARSRRGKFTVHVRTMSKRLRRSLTAIAEWCQEHRHEPVDEQQKTLNANLRGHYQYYGRPTNSQSLLKFYRGVVRIWRKWLNRRTRGNRMTWERYTELLRRHPLLPPGSDIPGRTRRVLLEEPAAGNLHGGVCEGGDPRWCHGRPKRARSWKRRIQPRKTYSPSGSPLLGEMSDLPTTRELTHAFVRNGSRIVFHVFGERGQCASYLGQWMLREYLIITRVVRHKTQEASVCTTVGRLIGVLTPALFIFV